jgi:acyl-CoA dehydrogenase
MSDADMIAEAAARILAECASPQRAWAALEAGGFTRIAVPEALGGAGLGLAEAFAVFTVCGRAAAPVPLADSLLAGWLLGAAGIAPPDGPLAVTTAYDAPAGVAFAGATLAGVAFAGAGVASAGVASAGVAGASFAQAGHVAAIEGARATLRAMPPAASAPAPLAEDGARPLALSDLALIAEAPAPMEEAGFRALAAAMRAAQMAGAMERALELALAHAAEREQFGRPLAAFQAIQHHLALIAAETAAARAAADIAAEAAARPLPCADLAPFMIAKIRCGEAAGAVAAAAHQVHGAMGFTRAHALGGVTRRLWQWQDDFGTDSFWAAALGESILGARGPLWHDIAPLSDRTTT